MKKCTPTIITNFWSEILGIKRPFLNSNIKIKKKKESSEAEG